MYDNIGHDMRQGDGALEDINRHQDDASNRIVSGDDEFSFQHDPDIPRACGDARPFRCKSWIEKRGRYDRNKHSVKKRLSLAQQAWNHRCTIENGKMRDCSCTCPYGGRCFRGLSENDLMACHNDVFGTTLSWDEQRQQPSLQHKTSDTQKAWRQIMNGIFEFNGDGRLISSETFIVANVRVCAEAMRIAHGIPSSTWHKYMSIGQKYPRALEMYDAEADFRRSEYNDRRGDQREGTKFHDALTWWLDWLSWCLQNAPCFSCVFHAFKCALCCV